MLPTDTEESPRRLLPFLSQRRSSIIRNGLYFYQNLNSVQSSTDSLPGRLSVCGLDSTCQAKGEVTRTLTLEQFADGKAVLTCNVVNRQTQEWALFMRGACVARASKPGHSPKNHSRLAEV